MSKPNVFNQTKEQRESYPSTDPNWDLMTALPKVHPPEEYGISPDKYWALSDCLWHRQEEDE